MEVALWLLWTDECLSKIPKTAWDLHLQEYSSLNSRCVWGTRLLQGMHVCMVLYPLSQRLETYKAYLGPTLPCTLKLLPDYNYVF